MMRLRLITVVLIGIAATAQGQNIYKCTDDFGTVVFSENLCASDAQRVYIDDSQSGISDARYNQSPPIYPPPWDYTDSRSQGGADDSRATRNNELAARKEARRIEKIHEEAQREFNRMIDKGYNTRAAKAAANVILSKVDNPRGEQAQREFNRMVKKGYNTKAAERAANVVLGRSSPVDDSPAPQWNNIPPEPQLDNIAPALPILSTRGGFYVPTSTSGDQYIPPGGVGLCFRQGMNLNCDGVVKPANGVVIEPPQ